jgi:flagellar basal body rod protein FlgG
VFLNPSLSAALDRIGERAADVRRAFTPGSVPKNDDVALTAPQAAFTLDPLSVAAPDGTYFVVRTVDGNAAYTRDGAFHVASGALLDEQNRPVLGMRAAGAPLTELRFDDVDDALNRTRDARIDADGTVSYARTTIDPRSGRREARRVSAGRIALAKFPAATKLRTEDGTTGVAPDGVVPYVGLPGDGGVSTVSPMRRGGSAVHLDESLARLKAAYVAFDALAAAETAKLGLGKTALDLIK